MLKINFKEQKSFEENIEKIRKELIKGQPTRCIRVNSDEHIFLITDKINKKWTGGNVYPYYGVYTYNIGEGKLVHNC